MASAHSPLSSAQDNPSAKVIYLRVTILISYTFLPDSQAIQMHWQSLKGAWPSAFRVSGVDVFTRPDAGAPQVARQVSASQPTTESSQCCNRNDLISNDYVDTNLPIWLKMKLGTKIGLVTTNQNKDTLSFLEARP